LNLKKIILDLCGGTGNWSFPYKKEDYDVRIITLPYWNIFDFQPPTNVYGILAAPPCTQFSNARTNAKNPRDLKGGMEVVKRCLEIIHECMYILPSNTSRKPTLKFWALENPNGMLKYFLGKPVFEFNPYDFGDDYKKKTHLWGWFNEPKKNPILCKKGKFDRTLMKDFINKLPKDYIIPEGSNRRQCFRSMTPSGFAEAFFQANK